MTGNEIEILLVEDNPADAELTLHVLRKDSFASRTHVVHDGQEALDFLFCQGPYSHRSLACPPRLVLLDLRLPRMDGLEVLRRLKNDPRTRLIPVVIFTSSKHEADMLAGYHLGSNSCIQKPVDFDQFRDTVRQLALYWLTVNQPPAPAAFLER